MEPKTAKNILYCDGKCGELIQKGEPYIPAGGMIFCVPCWGKPR